jgi:hypothetical protein
MELTEILLGISSGGVGSSFGFLRELFDEFWSLGAVVLWLSLLLLLLLMLLLVVVVVLLLGLVEVDFSRWRRLPRGLDFSLVSFAPSFELLLSFWALDLARSF